MPTAVIIGVKREIDNENFTKISDLYVCTVLYKYKNIYIYIKAVRYTPFCGVRGRDTIMMKLHGHIKKYIRG